jgi:hypothetical protein
MKTVFRLLLVFLITSLVCLFCSCDIYKKSNKTKSDSELNEQIETKTFRKGDTVHYEIPNIIYKDTIIYRTNRQGTTIRTEYDRSGNISSIDCFASAIEEFKKENRNLIETLKEKDSEKKEEMNTDWIMYGFITIGIVLIVALLLIFFYIKSQTQSILSIIPK